MTRLALLSAFLAGIAAAWLRRWRKDLVRERYFSFLAHELNTQVTGLQLTVENLLSGVFGPLADEHRKWVSAIEHRVDLLGCMIGDLRDVSHWEFGGKVRLLVEPVSLAETVDKELKRLEPMAARAKLVLDSRIPAGVPAVAADSYRLKRVVSAILHNILKFAEPGSTLTLQARPYAAQVLFQVSYKPAEPLERPERMLDMHYPALQKGSTLVSVGAGLGVCARVLAEMGGGMEITPAERGLLTITCLLPMSKA